MRLDFVWGRRLSANSGYSSGGSVQHPSLAFAQDLAVRTDPCLDQGSCKPWNATNAVSKAKAGRREQRF